MLLQNVEVGWVHTGGSIDALQIQGRPENWQWNLWCELNQNRSSPDDARRLFAGNESRDLGLPVISYQFKDLASYIIHHLEGHASGVGYILLWIEDREKWIGIAVEGEGCWSTALEDAVFADGTGNCPYPTRTRLEKCAQIFNSDLEQKYLRFFNSGSNS